MTGRGPKGSCRHRSLGTFRTSLAALLLALLVLSAGCVTVESVPDAADGEPSTDTPAESWTVEVTDVVDGDTMDVRYADGETDTIRLLGVDTPEVHGETDPAEYEGIPDTEAGREHLSAWGERASAYAEARLAGATVTIAVDPEADRRGSYGRLLVYLHVGDDLFNRRLIERGYARHYDAPHSRYHGFDAAEDSAQRAGTGLWGYPSTPSATWTVTPAGGSASPTTTANSTSPAGTSATPTPATTTTAAARDPQAFAGSVRRPGRPWASTTSFAGPSSSSSRPSARPSRGPWPRSSSSRSPSSGSD